MERYDDDLDGNLHAGDSDSDGSAAAAEGEAARKRGSNSSSRGDCGGRVVVRRALVHVS
jgi:hypothetical protein